MYVCIVENKIYVAQHPSNPLESLTARLVTLIRFLHFTICCTMKLNEQVGRLLLFVAISC